MPSSMRDWLRLPSRVAVLLGLGALSIAGAKAATGEESLPPRVPQQSVKAFGDLLIWSDAGRIYTAETGKPAEELRLGDTAEAELLRQLLEREGASAAAPRVLRDRVILVGAGGDGFHWDTRRSDNPNQTKASTHSGSTDAAPKK
jgi:hypothetical protein